MNRDRSQIASLGSYVESPPPPVPGHRGAKCYWLRQRTRVSWRVIAKKIGYASIEGARGGALRYAHRNMLPWPVKILSRGEMFYASFASGETWYDIARDFGITHDQARNAACGWAGVNRKPWPPRGKERWERNRRR